MSEEQTSSVEGGSKEPGGEHLNSLAKASSAYLRSAMHQPVEWQEWGEAAFAKAESEDKPILLDIGAVWGGGVGGGFSRKGKEKKKADSAGHRRGVVPLVSCDGSGVVRERGDGED